MSESIPPARNWHPFAFARIPAPPHHARRITLALLVSLQFAAAAAPGRTWSSAWLRDPAAWPQATPHARLAATPQGLRLEVPKGLKVAVVGADGLILPPDTGRIRVRLA